MLATFVLTFGIFLLVILGMALGAIFRNQPIAGSCGGLGNVSGIEASNCTCKRPCAKRRAAQQQAASSSEVKLIEFRPPN